MAIRFRCRHCDTLMSIATRKAGTAVPCPACDAEVLVPLEDQVAADPPAEMTSPLDSWLPEPALATASETSSPEDEIEFSEFQDDDAASPTAASSSPAAEGTSSESDEDQFAITLRKSGIDDEMDLTPMVDVVFQLLIFFMVTASFALHKTIQTPTPDPDQKGAAQSIQTLDELEGVAILVRIDGQNGITIDDDPLPDGGNVADALREKMRKEQKSEVIITADAATWHRTVVGVIDASNEVGMQKIRLTTRSGSNE